MGIVSDIPCVGQNKNGGKCAIMRLMRLNVIFGGRQHMLFQRRFNNNTTRETDIDDGPTLYVVFLEFICRIYLHFHSNETRTGYIRVVCLLYTRTRAQTYPSTLCVWGLLFLADLKLINNIIFIHKRVRSVRLVSSLAPVTASPHIWWCLMANYTWAIESR